MGPLQEGSKEQRNSFTKYCFPIIGNSTFMTAPIVGMLLDRYPTALCFLLLLYACQVSNLITTPSTLSFSMPILVPGSIFLCFRPR